MTTHMVNTHDAKTRLSELIRAVEAGDEVIIARNGEPVARIVAWESERPTRVPGAWRGLADPLPDSEIGPDPEMAILFGLEDE